MIDQAKLAQETPLFEHQAPSLSNLSEKELRKLRSDIDVLLPRGGLDGLNLEQELVDQYHAVKGLQAEVLTDPDCPANQRAQCAGQVAATLQKLIDLQVDMQRDERLKKIERALLDAIATLPESVKDEFFAEYEKLAEAQGATV
jgi:hypothetical protein